MIDLMVESRLDLPSAFSITFTDRRLSVIDRQKGELREGVKVNISLGYDGKHKQIFEGFVSTVSAEMSQSGVYSYVAGFDCLHLFARGTTYYSFVDSADEAQEDSLIVERIISDAKLTPVVTQTHKRNVPRTQDNCSDLEFMTTLAQLNGYFLYADGQKIHFSPDPPKRGKIRLDWQKGLETFYAKLSLDGLVKTLIMHGRDASLGENYETTMDRSDEELKLISKLGLYMLGYDASFVEDGYKPGSQPTNFPVESVSTAEDELPALYLSDAMVTSMADAEGYLSGYMRDEQALVIVKGSCTGDPNLLAGVELEVGGTGRFEGSYIVTRAVHRYNNNGYSTDFEAMRLG